MLGGASDTSFLVDSSIVSNCSSGGFSHDFGRGLSQPQRSTGGICILYQLDVFYGIWSRESFSSFFFLFSQLTILCLYEKDIFQFNRVDSADMMWFFGPCPNFVFFSFSSRVCNCIIVLLTLSPLCYGMTHQETQLAVANWSNTACLYVPYFT